MRTLGLIPARKNSERCPGKNYAMVNGKPLVVWTIEAAQRSAMFDDLLLTTDDPYLVDIAIQHGCPAMLRSASLAQPDTPMLPVVINAAERFKADIVVLLQPTSPLRTAYDIRAAHALLCDTQGDAVVSVTSAPDDLAFEVGHANRMRPSRTIVVPNGALYLITTEHLYRGGSWYDGITHAYFMPKERSLDIDTRMDLDVARMVMEAASIHLDPAP